MCFQQDLLERAKQTEEEWLPSALAQIRTVVDMRNQAAIKRKQQQQQHQQQAPTAYEQPIILAYSANPGLSPQTTQQCIAAGASGVVKPPFHPETARMVKRMVRAARDGRISSVVDLPPAGQDSNGGIEGQQTSRPDLLSRNTFEGPGGIGDQRGARDGTTKVVLPPTALDMGGEHEGEKVLEAAMTHRRQQSLSRSRAQSINNNTLMPPTHLNIPNINGLAPHANGQPTTPTTPGLPILLQNREIRTPITARTEYGQSPSGLRQEVTPSQHDLLHPYLATLSRYCPSYTPRRRSVDVGCLSIALDRATTAFESNPPLITSSSNSANINTNTTTATSTSGQSTLGVATPMARSSTSNQTTSSLTPASKTGSGSGKKRRQTDVHTHSHEEVEHEGAETHLAELLSAMYCHTTSVTDVNMEDYAE